MVSVVWRVSASHFDVNAFLQEFDLGPDVIWRRGEMQRGRPVPTSGFNLSISEAHTLEEGLADLRIFMAEKRKTFLTLQTRGLSNCIDFGFTVGGVEHFTRTLHFPPTDLAFFSELGVTLEISAYPNSGDYRGRYRGRCSFLRFLAAPAP